MATDLERLIRLLRAIGLDKEAAQKRAGQVRVLQQRGDALGMDAERLLEAMASQVGADTANVEEPGSEHDTDTLSPAELLSAIEEAVSQKAVGQEAVGQEAEPVSEDQISTTGIEPTLPQIGDPPESGSEGDGDLTLHAGERVDQYEVIRAIGRGGMGAV